MNILESKNNKGRQQPRKNNKGKQQPEKYGFIREKEQQRETTTRKVSGCCFPLLFFLSSKSILFWLLSPFVVLSL
jgi:hypothetical protein